MMTMNPLKNINGEERGTEFAIKREAAPALFMGHKTDLKYESNGASRLAVPCNQHQVID